ncbi:MAG TPA: hypothetical protein VHO25_07485 [Polyangiaceae bacterium]|nr:hypothetical protein [Polyangiaceae bacterium]
MRSTKYFLLSGLTIFAFNACGDDDSNVVLQIPPDASLDASLIPDGSLGGSGGSGGSSGGAGAGGQPDVADASLDATVLDAAADAAADSGIDAGPCADGVQTGTELGIDCGVTCGVACTAVFSPDASTLAIFELNGDLTDSSGNGRDAEPILALPDAGADAGDPADRWVDTEWGQGLSFPDSSDDIAHAWGFDWSQYANLIGDTFSVEMVFVTRTNDCYQRLFMFERGNDNGWYVCSGVTSYLGGIDYLYEPYPDGGDGNLTRDVRHYFVFNVHPGPTQDASSTQSKMDVYLNGARIGDMGSSFVSPPTDAIFFEDLDTGEQFNGVVDAVRISNGNRSTQEIVATWTKLNEQPL